MKNIVKRRKSSVFLSLIILLAAVLIPCMTLQSAYAAAYDTNLVVNGDCSNIDTKIWHTNGDSYITTNPGRDGTGNCFCFMQTYGATGYLFQNIDLANYITDIQKGNVGLELTGYVRRNNTASTGRIEVNMLNSGLSDIGGGSNSSCTSNDGNWEQIKITIPSININTQKIRVQLGSITTKAADYVMYDDISLKLFINDTTPPSAVENVTLTDSDNTVDGIDGRDFTVGFNDLADESDVASYKIYLYKDGEAPVDKAAMDVLTAVKTITRTENPDGTAVDLGSGVTKDSKGNVLSGGDYWVVVIAQDAAGNYIFPGGAAKATIKSDDNTPPSKPSITGISDDTGTPGDGITKDNKLVISGTAEANSSVEVFRGETSIGKAPDADGSGKWSFDYTATTLDEGTYSFTAKATDKAGNTSEASDTFTVKVDTAAPTVSLTHNHADSIVKFGDTVTLTATFSEDMASAPAISISGAGVSGAAMTDSGDHKVWTYNWAVPAGDMSSVVTVAGSDKADNAYIGTSSITFTVDNTKPSGYGIKIDQTAINNANKGAMSFTFNGAEVGATYNYTVTSSNGGSTTRNGSVTSTTQQVSGIDVSGTNDGTLTLSVTLTDSAGNAGDAVTATVDMDTVIPSVITISEQNSISGSGSLTLTAVGGPLSDASWTSILNQIKTNTGKGLYWITGIDAGDITITPAVDGVTATLNNGSTSAAAIGADFVITATNVEDKAGNKATGNITIDSYLSEARVTGVSAGTANGSYKADDTIAINITFDTNVDVTDTPVLHLETGATDRDAAYASGTGSTTLTFNYTVQAGDTSSDLEYKDVNSLVLGGGTIRNKGKTIDAVLTLPTPGAAGSLGNAKAIVIDTTSPQVATVENPGAGAYKAGQNLDFKIKFSENVTITGTGSTLSIDIGGVSKTAVYQSKTADSITYRYTVQNGDNDSDGITMGLIAINGTTITDVAGNSAITGLSGSDHLTWLLVDTTAPAAVTGITLEDKDSTLGIDGRDFTVGFNDLADESDVASYKVYIYKDGQEPADQAAMDALAVDSKVVAKTIAKTAGDNGIDANLGSSLTKDSKGQALEDEDYQVIVTTVDAAGNYTFAKIDSKVSVKSDAAPLAPSTPSTSDTPKPEKPDGQVIVAAASNETEKIDGKTVTTVNVDDEKLMNKLNEQGQGSKIVIPVTETSDTVVGTLNGETIKGMEKKEAVLEIKTSDATYTLPASQINVDSVSEQIGTGISLKDIKVSVKIAKPDEDTVKVIEDTADKNNYQLVVKPVEFSVTCTSGNKTVEVSRFNGYVERMVAIPDGVDPSKITTGVVLNNDGTLSHVPTDIIKIDGKWYAKIKSLTNSTYSVIYNQKSFTDVEGSWAKDAINDMGSRLIISGIGDDKFGPDLKITRAEFASIIVRALGLMRPGTGKDSFKDVSKDAWYYDAVSIAYENGIISGCGNGQFKPLDNITREQAMSMIMRAMKITGLKVDLNLDGLKSSFKDSSSVSKWAEDSVTACIKAGIIPGVYGDKLAPLNKATRAEIADMVRKLLQKSGLI